MSFKDSYCGMKLKYWILAYQSYIELGIMVAFEWPAVVQT